MHRLDRKLFPPFCGNFEPIQTRQRSFENHGDKCSCLRSSADGSVNGLFVVSRSSTLEATDDCAVRVSPPPGTVTALSSLAQTILALVSGDEAQARTLCWTASKKKQLIEQIFNAYDTCESGTLSVEEARALFIDLSRSIVTEIADRDSNATSANATEGERFFHMGPSTWRYASRSPGRRRTRTH